MTPAEVVVRGRSALGKGTKYTLGKGGYKPTKTWVSKESDCSGFVAWCFGVSRILKIPYYQELNGGWFETSALYKDAQSTRGFVDEVLLSECDIGDLFLWPDRDGKQGHVGIISEVDLGLEVPTKVLHCSSGNWKKYGDAIQETSTHLFLEARGIVARVAWLEEAEIG